MYCDTSTAPHGAVLDGQLFQPLSLRGMGDAGGEQGGMNLFALSLDQLNQLKTSIEEVFAARARAALMAEVSVPSA